MNTPPNWNWIQSIASTFTEALRTALGIRTKKQLIGFLSVLGALLFVLWLVIAPTQQPGNFSVIQSQPLYLPTEFIPEIKRAEERTQAEAVIVYAYTGDGLHSIYSTKANVPGQDIPEAGNSSLYGELRLINCDTIKPTLTDTTKGAIDRSTGARLPMLICPIISSVVVEDPQLQKTFISAQLIGAIAAAYYTFPRASAQGEYDPSAGVIYVTGFNLQQYLKSLP